VNDLLAVITTTLPLSNTELLCSACKLCCLKTLLELKLLLKSNPRVLMAAMICVSWAIFDDSSFVTFVVEMFLSWHWTSWRILCCQVKTTWWISFLGRYSVAHVTQFVYCNCTSYVVFIHTHTLPFYSPLSTTTWVRRYQKTSFWILRIVGKIIEASVPTIRLDATPSRPSMPPPPSCPQFYTGFPFCRNPPSLSWIGTVSKYAVLHTLRAAGCVLLIVSVIDIGICD